MILRVDITKVQLAELLRKYNWNDDTTRVRQAEYVLRDLSEQPEPEVAPEAPTVPEATAEKPKKGSRKKA